jgi:hypothetical protein
MRCNNFEKKVLLGGLENHENRRQLVVCWRVGANSVLES